MSTNAADGVIIVANRSPYDFDRGDICHHGNGGLVQAMEPVLGPDSLWVGISRGDDDFEKADKDHKISLPSITMRKVFVPEATYVSYYNSFANSFLWPLMHCDTRAWFEEAEEFPTPQFDATGYRCYRLVNQTFATAVVEELLQNPQRDVWLHDYHFMELPALVRRMCAEHGLHPKIGQTWHIPWVHPASLDAVMPPRTSARKAFTDLVCALLENDVLSFHTHRYAVNFIQTLKKLDIDCRVVERREDRWCLCYRMRKNGGFESKTLEIAVLPIGINVDAVVSATADDATYDALSHRFARTQAYLHRQGRILCAGLERLDYSKGIPARLRMLDQLCYRYPLTYYGVAQPSRGDIPAYQELRETVAALTESANRRHSTGGIPPITVEMESGITPPANYVFLKHADVCLMTTLSDGMNLVVLEAILSKHALPRSQRGFIVLGTSGARNALSFFDESDGIVRLPDPLDVGRSAQVISDAIDRRVTISDRLIRHVRSRYVVTDWSSAFLERLRHAQ